MTNKKSIFTNKQLNKVFAIIVVISMILIAFPNKALANDQPIAANNYKLSFVANDVEVAQGTKDFDLKQDISAKTEADEDVTVEISKNDGFDIQKIGTYQIEYKATHPVSQEEFTTTRTVVVKAAPVAAEVAKNDGSKTTGTGAAATPAAQPQPAPQPAPQNDEYKVVVNHYNLSKNNQKIKEADTYSFEEGKSSVFVYSLVVNNANNPYLGQYDAFNYRTVYIEGTENKTVGGTRSNIRKTHDLDGDKIINVDYYYNYKVISGSVTYGLSVENNVTETYGSPLSVLGDNVYLFNDTILNNIKFGKPDATQAQVEAAAKKACCHEFICALPNGYNTIIGESGASVSGGEKQRISIARAILKDAPIIILDEATANVDPENELELQKAIAQLTKNKTIIMIAHRLKTIRNAEQILVMDQGKIVQRGTHNELIKQKGIYADLINVRKSAIGWKLKSQPV